MNKTNDQMTDWGIRRKWVNLSGLSGRGRWYGLIGQLDSNTNWLWTGRTYDVIVDRHYRCHKDWVGG